VVLNQEVDAEPEFADALQDWGGANSEQAENPDDEVGIIEEDAEVGPADFLHWDYGAPWQITNSIERVSLGRCAT
jgi:hypothetical protein